MNSQVTLKLATLPQHFKENLTYSKLPGKFICDFILTFSNFLCYNAPLKINISTNLNECFFFLDLKVFVIIKIVSVPLMFLNY